MSPINPVKYPCIQELDSGSELAAPLISLLLRRLFCKEIWRKRKWHSHLWQTFTSYTGKNNRTHLNYLGIWVKICKPGFSSFTIHKDTQKYTLKSARAPTPQHGFWCSRHFSQVLFLSEWSADSALHVKGGSSRWLGKETIAGHVVEAQTYLLNELSPAVFLETENFSVFIVSGLLMDLFRYVAF